MWSLYPYSVTRFEDSLLLIVCRHRCSIDSFQPYVVPIAHIGWCCSRGHVILWHDIVPVYCFWYSTPFSDGNPFYCSVTSLDDAVTRGDICTAESKSDSPLISEGFIQAALKGCLIICQNLCWRAPLIEECLQLVDYTCRGRHCQMANQAGPQSITVKKWAPFQWVMSIATRCHVCVTFKAPFDQSMGAESID